MKPPINEPTALPIASSIFAPSFISQLSPGICCSKPIAANIPDISTNIAPAPATPAIAFGIDGTSEANVFIKTPIIPTETTAFNNVPVSTPFIASARLENNAAMTFSAALTMSGIFCASPSSRFITNWSRLSIIDGECLTNDLSISSIV